MDKEILYLRANRQNLAEQCTKNEHRCSRIDPIKGNCCTAYHCPAAKWRLGDCPMADKELRTIVLEEKTKVRVGQQKQKKKK